MANIYIQFTSKNKYEITLQDLSTASNTDLTLFAKDLYPETEPELIKQHGYTAISLSVHQVHMLVGALQQWLEDHKS